MASGERPAAGSSDVTARYGHGLIVSKFYPPHAGHHFLIDTAASMCDRLTVVLAASAQESIPAELRAAWLEERHPGVTIAWGYDEHPVDYDDPQIWDAHMAVFRSLCPEPVDAVFSSEPYGAELARRFGAAEVAVDIERSTVPVSGTAVRADPRAHWGQLEPPVRAWLVKRVAIVGAESTGTTTLARDLAAHYDTAWVPEYGRTLTEERIAAGTPVEDIQWTDADFVMIARRQQRDEDAAARASGPVLICDTDALATCIWQERYLGRSTDDVEAIAASRSYALTILTDDDTPFEQDGARDGEHLRHWMTERFAHRLGERGGVSLCVSGSRAERLAAAVSAIDAILDAGWDLAPPIQPARGRDRDNDAVAD